MSQRPTPPEAVPADARSRLPPGAYAQRAALLLGALVVLRALYAAFFELAGDEAYYWVWSRHPAWCYYSKGPLVAWTIALGTRILGDTALGVRCFAVLLSFLTGWLLYRLGARLFDPRTGWWAVVVTATVPIFQMGGILMTIDPLSVFFWVAATLVFWRAKDSVRPGPWLAAGLLVGVGALAKYTNLVQLLCFALFLFARPARGRRRPIGRFGLLVLTALLCLAPVVIWNMQHDWITLEHLTHRGALDQSFRPKPAEFAAFAASQAVVLTPLYLIGLVWALLRRADRTGPRGEAFAYLATLIAPLLILYGLLSFNGEWEANWTAPSLTLAPLLLAASWGPPVRRLRWARGWAVVSVAFAALLSAALYVALATPWLFGDGRFRRIGGARDLARKVAAVERAQDARFVIAGGYQLAGLLSFYLPDHPATYLPELHGMRNQFSFWPNYREQWPPGTSAIYIHKSPAVRPVLTEQFAAVEPLGDTWSVYRGRRMRRYYLYLCRRLTGGGSDAGPPGRSE